MFLEIVTPEASIFRGEVNSVTVPGVDGQFQMLNNHAPIVSLLQEGEVKFEGEVTIEEDFRDKFTAGKHKDTVLQIKGGTVEMNDNKVIILVD